MDTIATPRGDSPVASSIDLDVLIAGDLRVASEAAFRTLHQTVIQCDAGYQSGLLHLPCVPGQVFSFINPEIDRLVRTGKAHAVDPGTSLVTARLLIIESAVALCRALLDGKQLDVPRIVAERVLIVLDEDIPTDRLKKYHALLSTLVGSNARWVAATPDARASLAIADIPHDPNIWRVSVSLSGEPMGAREKRAATIIGRTSFATGEEWPRAGSLTLSHAYPDGGNRVMRVLALPWLSKNALDVPDDWRIMTLRHMSSFAFLRNLDFFLYFPGGEDVCIPAHAMAWAMAHGVPVIADRKLSNRLGKGPIYAAPEDVHGLIDKQSPTYDQLVAEAVSFARRAFGPEIHRQRLEQLIGPPRRPAFNIIGRNTQKRVLFTCTNGMGIGHVTRLMSVARRLPEGVIPVFGILSPAAKLVRQAGFPVEYLPSAGSALCDPQNWNDWLRDELLRIIDFHDIQGVMFDGGHPFQGVISAMRARPNMRSVWMRRALWREEQVNEPIIARQHYFDLIMEPSDIAESADKGATVDQRDLTLTVDPIFLLDEEDLLSREEAAKRIGLDPEKPACLLQLGAGTNRDILALMDGAIGALRAVADLQIVVARWPISGQDTDFWPETICLRGYPISKYYRAFNFTISATGYNSFHEIITFGLPAIFMANNFTGLDDQAARADFAQQNDAGFHLPETRVDAIGTLIESIMDESTQMIIRSNCQRLSRPNGAAQAAQVFAELVA